MKKDILSEAIKMQRMAGIINESEYGWSVPGLPRHWVWGHGFSAQRGEPIIRKAKALE